MSKDRSAPARKKRTRAHVIADLGAHYVEGPILRCGFTAERVVRDYGVDLYMTTYTEVGEVENDFVLLQLKATDRLSLTSDGSAVVARLDRFDVNRWVSETFPVILVVYDARVDRGYWLYVQEFFEHNKNLLARTAKSVTVHIPIANVLVEDSIRQFAASKAAVQAQTRGVNHHE